MNKKELRIGNLVSDVNSSDSFFADVKRLSYRRCYYGLFDCKYSDLKPIPLTEEWLLKFGFKFSFELRKKCYSNSDYSIIFWFFRNGRVDARISGVEFSENHKNKNRLIYVHQLQNIYFALTGEELTLKNK